MNGRRPRVVATVIATGTAAAVPIDWDETSRLFAAERSYWVATTSDQDRPRLRPVLAVCVGERIYFTTSPAARKARDLASRPSAALAAHAPDIDIVIEGSATWIDDRQQLRRIGDAYQDKYRWPVTVTADNAFDAPYAAPTAGHPPYRACELTPTVAYAFGTGSNLAERSTRYRFDT
jgi:hypothetical protein